MRPDSAACRSLKNRLKPHAARSGLSVRVRRSLDPLPRSREHARDAMRRGQDAMVALLRKEEGDVAEAESADEEKWPLSLLVSSQRR